MSYNKDIDYQEKINEAVKIGDYKSAAQYEKSRNEKIDGENLGVEKTNRFGGWLEDTDYSIKLREQMGSGASKKTVADTLAKRVDKAKGTEGLIKYARDDVYDEAVRYIMSGNTFSYQEKAPEYKSSYDDDIRRLLSEITKTKKFSYNPLEDELYEYYKKEYQREGDLAMEDILGSLAINTGGVASSYATSAAMQGRNYYSEKLTDKIPELYVSAYERYLDELGIKGDNLEALLDIRDTDYEIYKDSLNQYNKDREFEYKKFLDEQDYESYLREEEREREELEYEKFLDNREYEKYLSEEAKKDAENEEEKRQSNIKLALDKWKALGYLDEESAKILGLPSGLHTSDYDYKKAQQYKIYQK